MNYPPLKYRFVFLLLYVVAFRIGFAQEKNIIQFNSFFFRGVKNYIIGNYNKSIKNLGEALIYMDTVPAVYYYMALDYDRVHMDELKIQYIEKAIHYAPDEKIFRDTLENWKKMSSGTNSTEKKKSPSTREENSFLPSLERQIQSGQYQEAYRKGKQLLEKYPYDGGLVYLTALAAYHLKKFDEARQLLENGMDFVLTDEKMHRKFLQLLQKIKSAGR